MVMRMWLLVVLIVLFLVGCSVNIVGLWVDGVL